MILVEGAALQSQAPEPHSVCVTCTFGWAWMVGAFCRARLSNWWPAISSPGFTVRTQTGRAPLAGSVGDFSWGGASGTYSWVDPQEELTVVFMEATPSQIHTNFRTLLKNLVLASIVDWRSDAVGRQPGRANGGGTIMAEPKVHVAWRVISLEMELLTQDRASHLYLADAMAAYERWA
jgi:CubicO group peptidase (beta-lactamase class C family)